MALLSMLPEQKVAGGNIMRIISLCFHGGSEERLH